MHPDTRRTVVRQAYRNSIQRPRMQRHRAQSTPERFLRWLRSSTTKKPYQSTKDTVPITTGEIARFEARHGFPTSPTAGLVWAYIRTKLVVLPSEYGDDFIPSFSAKTTLSAVRLLAKIYLASLGQNSPVAAKSLRTGCAHVQDSNPSYERRRFTGQLRRCFHADVSRFDHSACVVDSAAVSRSAW